MKRLVFAAAMLLAAGSFASGCRSCQSPYDYSSPVAGCECQTGPGRAGSVLSGEYETEGAYEYYDEGSVESYVPTEAPSVESAQPVPVAE